MPLNIEVKADTAGLRDLASWFGTGAESMHNAGTAAIGARTSSEQDWGGASGAAFQGVMSRTSTGIDDVSADMTSAQTTVSTFADDMDTVKSRMGQARDVASAAGLVVTDTEIMEPGPPPPGPQPLPTDGSATPEQQQANTAAQSAVAAHEAQVAAYNQAAQIVTEARGKENAALNLLAKVGNELVAKAPFTISDIATGLAGETLKRTSKFRALAATYGRYADRALQAALRTPVTSPAFTTAAQRHAQFFTKQAEALDEATRTLPARALDQLPNWAKGALTTSVEDFAFRGGSTAANVGRAVLGKIPILGIAITAASTGYDISQGKNAVQSVVSGVSSLAAGAATGAAAGAAFGGPVGVVVGAGVGFAVGFVVDEWGDEIAYGVGEGAKAVGEGAKAVSDTVATGARKVGEFFDGLF
jgi:uncharacterized protein YukE